MNDESLTDVLDDKADYLAYKKAKTIEKLSERTHLTLEKIGKLASHPEHGEIVGSITLDELIQVKVEAALAEAGIDEDRDHADEEEAPTTPKKKVAATKKKVTAKKASRAPTQAKKTAKKKAVKKITQKASDGRKADFGQKKPRLNREQGYKEIIAALKAAGEPCGRGEIEEATGYSGVQVRTFCKELAEQGKIQILGKGGRSTKYTLA